MEPTTTGAAPTDGVVATTQPVEGAQPTAAQPTEPVSQSQPTQANDEFAAWMQSKSLDPTAQDAFTKAAQMAYNSEKLMTKATQEASELKRSLTQPVQPVQSQDGTQVDPGVQEFMQDYRRDKLINGFKESHKDWSEHEPAMVQKLSEQVNTPYGVFTRSQLVNAGFLSLEDVYSMAKASAPVNTDQIRNQAQQEVLQTLANTQRAGGGNAQASNSNPQSPTVDPIAEAIRKARG
jgi:hypothetical protein